MTKKSVAQSKKKKKKASEEDSDEEYWKDLYSQPPTEPVLARTAAAAAAPSQPDASVRLPKTQSQDWPTAPPASTSAVVSAREAAANAAELLRRKMSRIYKDASRAKPPVEAHPSSEPQSSMDGEYAETMVAVA